MFRVLTVLLLLFVVVAPLRGQPPKVVVVKPEDPIWTVVQAGLDLSDDLGLHYWDGTGDPDLVFTKEKGQENAKQINDALAGEGDWQGNPVAMLGDQYGRYFPVAAYDGNPYAIRIPGTPPAYGGVFYGTGFLARGNIPAGAGHSDLRATAFVCVSDPTEPGGAPYEEQEVIRYDGANWWVGPFNIIGRYSASNSEMIQAVKDGEVAGYGFRVGDGPAGRLIGALSVFYCQQGIFFNRDASCTWNRLQFRGVRDCYVSDNSQAVAHNILDLNLRENLGTVFDFRAGGALNVRNVAWNSPALLLRIGNPTAGNRRYEIHGIKMDAQVFRRLNTPDPATRVVSSITGQPARLLERTDNSPASAYTVRMTGISSTSPHAWFKDLRMIQNRGHLYDVIVDINGLPADEAIAFAHKAAPLAAPTAFTEPDVGRGDDFMPPDLSKVVSWYDFGQADHVNIDEGGLANGAEIKNISPRWGNFGPLAPASPGNTWPRLKHDGLHHRWTAEFGATSTAGGYLDNGSNNPDRHVGMDELEVHVLAAAETVAATGNPTFVGAWRAMNDNRAWRIFFRRDAGQPEHKKVFAQLSFNGTLDDALTLEAPNPLGFETPALITLRYNGMDVEREGLQPGEAALTVSGVGAPNEETVKQTRPGGPVSIYGAQAPLRIGALAGSGNPPASSFGLRGRISEVAVLDKLSTLVEGDDEATGATPDTGELPEIRRYFRRKYGVW